jgi:hypothetical protein
MKNPCAGCPNVKAGCKVRANCSDFNDYESYMLNIEYPAHQVRRCLENAIAGRSYGRSNQVRRLAGVRS